MSGFVWKDGRSALVGVLYNDGSWLASYLRTGGELEYAGRVLVRCYDRGATERLLDRGSIQSLGETPKKSPRMGRSDGVPANIAVASAEYWKNSAADEAYLLSDNGWMMYRPDAGAAWPWMPVRELLNADVDVEHSRMASVDVEILWALGSVRR